MHESHIHAHTHTPHAHTHMHHMHTHTHTHTHIDTHTHVLTHTHTHTHMHTHTHAHTHTLRLSMNSFVKMRRHSSRSKLSASGWRNLQNGSPFQDTTTTDPIPRIQFSGSGTVDAFHLRNPIGVHYSVWHCCWRITEIIL